MNRRIVRLAAAAALAFGSVGVTATTAFADPGNSHSNQEDGCTHGNSGQPCRPDPQPNHGKDCDVHGNWGGVNEDHCDNGDSEPI
ncbi:MAG: hypothetical protein V9G19_24275 [Tetrasphaera sp.]